MSAKISTCFAGLNPPPTWDPGCVSGDRNERLTQTCKKPAFAGFELLDPSDESAGGLHALDQEIEVRGGHGRIVGVEQDE